MTSYPSTGPLSVTCRSVKIVEWSKYDTRKTAEQIVENNAALRALGCDGGR